MRPNPNLELASQARPARSLPLWPLIAVIALYGLTFALGYMASNDAEQRFAMSDESAWTAP